MPYFYHYKSDVYIPMLDKVASFFSLNKISLTKRIIKTFEEAVYFNKILNQYKPKIAFVVCYYSRLVYPFLLACTQIQHSEFFYFIVSVKTNIVVKFESVPMLKNSCFCQYNLNETLF